MDGCVGKRARHIGTRTIPRYVISHRNGGAPKLLRISLRTGDEKALSVLSSGMLARGFLRCGDLGPEWRVRESHSGELVSLLLGPYTDVISIRLNPLPGPLAAEDALLNLLLRGEFSDCLLAREQGRSG
jgi:hypothetical protein